MKYLLISISLLSFVLQKEVFGQQLADTSFLFTQSAPTYPNHHGPRVLIDEAHHNFHTYEGRFSPFAKLIAGDGYRPGPFTKKFTSSSLKKCDILVIANPLHGDNVGRWILPNPSAFSTEEMIALDKWVKGGGSLLLIADHMPFAGAAMTLGSVFGFGLRNGFAMRIKKEERYDVFKKSNNGLRGESILKEVDSVMTFSGSAFLVPEEVQPILVFDENYHIAIPDTAWRFHALTTRINLKGWCQGAIREYGKGRVAVFGEAAMFTNQVVGDEKVNIGFNHQEAPDNPQFILNVMHWLDGED